MARRQILVDLLEMGLDPTKKHKVKNKHLESLQSEKSKDDIADLPSESGNQSESLDDKLSFSAEEAIDVEVPVAVEEVAVEEVAVEEVAVEEVAVEEVAVEEVAVEVPKRVRSKRSSKVR